MSVRCMCAFPTSSHVHSQLLSLQRYICDGWEEVAAVLLSEVVQPQATGRFGVGPGGLSNCGQA